jgi:hypothetical protein
MKRSDVGTWARRIAGVILVCAVVASCGGSDSTQSSSGETDGGGSDAGNALEASGDRGSPGQDTGGADGASQGDVAVGDDGGGDAASQGDGGNDAASMCTDACESCLTKNCSSSLAACNADATCSQSIQYLWTCRCGDGGQCSQQCAFQCANSFYGTSGPVGHSLWQTCGKTCAMCAFG